MTFAEMRTETELLYESINSSAAPGFTTTEWGQILTVAQRKVVKRILEEGVTRDATNMLAIEILFDTETYNAFSADDYFRNSDGSYAKVSDVILNADFFWILDEYAKTSTVNNIKLKRISFDFYRINIDNPFRQPNVVDGFWILQKANKPVYITDGTVITEHHVMGVEHPDNYPIASGANCVLNVGVHSNIVEEAVKLARMSVIDPQGYQLSTIEFAK